MKILAVGDPHGVMPKRIPRDLDLILITGDIGKADLARKRFFKDKEREGQGLEPLERDSKFIRAVYNQTQNSTINILKRLSKYAPVYTLEGNVGISKKADVKRDNKKYKLNLIPSIDRLKKIRDVNVVKNRLRIINGLRIGFLEYFTDISWVKEFKPKDYDVELEQAKDETEKARRILERFGNGLDILVCHQPPYGFLDKVNFPGAPKSWQGKHAESKAIRNYIRKYHPRFVLCGHIHEAKGTKLIGNTTIYNLGCCGDSKIIEL